MNDAQKAVLIRGLMILGAVLLAFAVVEAVAFMQTGSATTATLALAAGVTGMCLLIPAGFALAMLRGS